MRSSPVVANQSAYVAQYNNLRADARGASSLLAQQMVGYFSLGTAPINGQTVTLTINGSAIVFTAVGSIGTAAGNVLNPGTAAGFTANLLALLNQPQTTTAKGVALSSATQTLLSYLSFVLIGTTLYILNNNVTLYAPLTSFGGSTTVSSGSFTTNTMALFVHKGTVYVNGTRVLFSGGITSTVTAPSTNPRIDVLTIDNTGTLAWTTGTENASPTPPTYPANKVAIWELYNVVAETQLLGNENQASGQGYIYNDVRPIVTSAFNPASIPDSLLPSTDGGFDLGSPSFEWGNIYAKNGIFLNGASINAVLLSSFIAGQSIVPGQHLCILPFPAADVMLDANGTFSGSGTTVTQAFAVGANSNRGFVVALNMTTTSADVSTMAYGGASMTKIQSGNTGGNIGQRLEVWYLNAPATGTNNLVITFSSTAPVNFNIYSYYNVSQSGQPEASVVNSGNTTTVNSVLTPLTNGALVFGCASASLSGTAFTNNTKTNSNLWSGDSGPVYPQSQQTGTATTSGNGSIILIALAPVGTSVTPRAYLANATLTAQTAYIGVAQGTASVGGSITSALGGIDSNQSGLTIGSQYYLSNTPGAISTSPGSVTRKVGIAVDTTKLLITNIW
jgi:hypothetical protein